MFLVGAGHPGLGDDKRQTRRVKIAAHVTDEMCQVTLVFVVELVVDAIVPALVPAEPAQHVAAVAARHQVLDICQRRFREGQRLAVVFAEDRRVGGDRGIGFVAERVGRATGARRTEIDGQAFAAPGAFDQQHRFFQRLAHHPAKAQFRAEHIPPGAVSRDQRSVAVEQANPDIIPRPPVTHVIQQRPEFFCSGEVPGKILERSAAAVAVRVGLDPAVPLHVRLADQDKHADRPGLGCRVGIHCADEFAVRRAELCQFDPELRAVAVPQHRVGSLPARQPGRQLFATDAHPGPQLVIGRYRRRRLIVRRFRGRRDGCRRRCRFRYDFKIERGRFFRRRRGCCRVGSQRRGHVGGCRPGGRPGRILAGRF